MKAIDRAKANFDLGKNLRAIGEHEWACVCFFYAALHVTNHALKPIGCRTHGRRAALIRAHAPQIETTYAGLRYLSEVARYEPYFHKLTASCSLDAHDRAQDIAIALLGRSL